ncbi:hypothetical protein B0H14DRAFT_3426838 [Mycena olivaceomarginata]|nr:hypothetical protein B0H14DRAFT_3426838 [Mycena olivaceomarginata]
MALRSHSHSISSLIPLHPHPFIPFALPGRARPPHGAICLSGLSRARFVGLVSCARPFHIPAHTLPSSVSSLPSSSFSPSRPSLILLPCVSSLPSSSLLAIVSGSAISGGAFAGWTSQFLGRRNTIVAFTLLTAVFIPSSFSGLARGAISVQYGMQGVWGIIPTHLAEMAPPAFHATFPGVAYQLVSMVSSASAQIKATGGEHLKTTIKDMVVPDYAKVQGILIGVVAAFVLFITIIGPEGIDAGRRIDRRRPRAPRDGALGARSAGENEKASEERSSTEKPAATPTTAAA